DDVFTSIAASPTFVEQLERLADTCGVAKKDLQLTSLFGSLGGFDLTKNGLGVAGTRAIVAVNTHEGRFSARLYPTRKRMLALEWRSGGTPASRVAARSTRRDYSV